MTLDRTAIIAELRATISELDTALNHKLEWDVHVPLIGARNRVARLIDAVGAEPVDETERHSHIVYCPGCGSTLYGNAAAFGWCKKCDPTGSPPVVDEPETFIYCRYCNVRLFGETAALGIHAPCAKLEARDG